MGIRLRVGVRKFSDFERAMEEQIGKYRAARPEVEIEAVALDLHALHGELLDQEGLRKGNWDIGLVVTDWLAEAVERGALEELTPRMRKQPVRDWPEGWARSITEPLDFDGRIYSLPWHDGPECLMYRRDFFEDASEQEAFQARFGYELAPPKSWEEFLDVARFFTRPESGRYGTVVAAYPDGHNTLYDFALQVWSRGGELTKLSSPAAIEGLDFYRNLVRDATRCHPGAEELDSTRSGDVFLAGKTAMMVNWFGFAARCHRPGSELAGRVGIAPIPAAKGCKPVSLSVFWTLGIGSGSRNKDAAYDFLRFAAEPEQDLGLVRHGTVGCRLSTWWDKEVQRRVPAYKEIEAISLGARRLPRSRALPKLAEIVNRVVEQALRSGESSEGILRRAQAEAEGL